jgi:cobalt/nickel transport system permease protein
MCAAVAAANAYAVKKIKKDELCEKKIPVMGVMGAFVFAAQMINFTIPGTGSSGHIGGGILLAAMIGGFPALLSISAVIVIQCLFFADGGLLALGCNIFNMGVVPCLIVYPLIFKPFFKSGRTIFKIAAASVAAAVLTLQLGAFGVVLQTRISGIAELPFLTFLFLMQPIHFAIGLAEGIATAAILCFVYKMRPEIMDSAFERTKIKSGVPVKNVVIAFSILALLVGGAFSLFASPQPDGLEWAIEKTAGMEEPKAEGAVFEGAASIQKAVAFMPDYNFKNTGENGFGMEKSVAGIIGGLMAFLTAAVSAIAISVFKKRRKDSKSK